MQVYRGMDIGTAKPTAAERAAVPHHMIDLVDPSERFSVGRFQREGTAVLEGLSDDRVLVVGGSGLHFRSLVDPLEFPPSERGVKAEVEALERGDAVAALLAVDPGAPNHVDMANPRRVARALEVHRITGLTPSHRAGTPQAQAVRDYEPARPFVAVGVDPGGRLAARVERRLDAMLDAGLLDEVSGLQGQMGRTASSAVGYRQLLPVVRGDRTLAEGRSHTLSATTGLARRQRTYFRRDPRIRWVEWEDDADRRTDAVLGVLEEAGWTS
jgi:tRNA dimethylallyltransferase